MNFGVPVSLEEVIVRNGALDANSDYRFFRRARQVTIVMQFVDGSQKQKQVTFADSRIGQISGVNVIADQHVKLNSGKAVARLEFVVQSTYDAPPNSPLAITELEFFTKKG